MNYSRQRSLILDIIKNTKTHPTADWVYQEAKKELPTIGIATVYRNLNTLVEMGEVRRLVSGDGQDRFDGDIGEHFHMKCTCCGGLVDLEPEDDSKLFRLKKAIGEAFPGLGEGVELDAVLLKGLCAKCIDEKKNGYQ